MSKTIMWLTNQSVVAVASPIVSSSQPSQWRVLHLSPGRSCGSTFGTVQGIMSDDGWLISEWQPVREPLTTIGISLSGGGYRGTVRRRGDRGVADAGLAASVTWLASASGGSLTSGYVLSQGGWLTFLRTWTASLRPSLLYARGGSAVLDGSRFRLSSLRVPEHRLNVA